MDTHTPNKTKSSPKPYVFADKDELLTILADKATTNAIDTFIARNETDVATIVKASVNGNTFRAFPLPDGLRPSIIYRSWVTARLSQCLEQFRLLSTPPEMRRLVLSAANDLCTHWLTETQGKRDIGFGRAAKLLNLSFKHMLWHHTLPRTRRMALLDTLDVPLDSFTLQGLHRVLPNLQIPRSASMGHVREEARYAEIQDAIRALCAPRFSPIHYEYAAWNLAHPTKTP